MFANFHLKDFMLLGYYVLRKLVLEIFFVGRCWFNDILLCFGRFCVIERFRFYEISLIFFVSIFKTSKIHK